METTVLSVMYSKARNKANLTKQKIVEQQEIKVKGE